MTKMAVPRHLPTVTAAVGILLQAYISFFKTDGDFGLFSVGLFAWGSVPYVLCIVFARIAGPDYGLYGAIACLIGSMLTYFIVFVDPSSSTAAIHLLFSPAFNVFVFLPIGIALGHINKRVSNGPPTPAR